MALAHCDPIWTWGSLGKKGESDVKEKTRVTKKTGLEAPRFVPTQGTSALHMPEPRQARELVALSLFLLLATEETSGQL